MFARDKEDPLDLQGAETSTGIAPVPSLPMKSIWRTIRGYIWWSYERGSLHYDVMVTLILLFVFLSPRWVNFKDKPVERNPLPTGVVVVPDNQGGFIYQIEASAISAKDEAAVRDQLLRIIEPISGEVSITKYEPVRDRSGRILHYKVWVQKE